MNIRDLLYSPTVSVFLGTLPLLLTIAWGLLSNSKRMDRMETKLDDIAKTLATVSERLVKVETKLEMTPQVIRS